MKSFKYIFQHPGYIIMIWSPGQEWSLSGGIISIANGLGKLVVNAIQTFLQAEDQAKVQTRLSLNALGRAYNNQVIYIVGKEQLRIRKRHKYIRRFVLSLLLWIRGIAARKV